MTVPQGERISKLERGLEDHEKACLERLKTIQDTATATQKSVEGLQTRFLAIAGALLIWALTQVWATLQANNHVQQPTQQTVNVRPAS